MLTIVAVAVLCSLSGADAIMCANCTEMTSSTSSIPLGPPGAVNDYPCVETGGAVNDCLETTKCSYSSFKYFFTDSNGAEVSLTNTQRGCGEPYLPSGCLPNSLIQQQVNQSLPYITPIFQSLGYTYARFEGRMCTCDDGDKCNQFAEPGSTPEPVPTDGMAAVGTTPSGASAFLSNMVLMVTSILSAVTFRAL